VLDFDWNLGLGNGNQSEVLDGTGNCLLIQSETVAKLFLLFDAKNGKLFPVFTTSKDAGDDESVKSRSVSVIYRNKELFKFSVKSSFPFCNLVIAV